MLVEVIEGMSAAAEHALAFVERRGWRRRRRRHHAYGMEDGEGDIKFEVHACMVGGEKGLPKVGRI